MPSSRILANVCIVLLAAGCSRQSPTGVPGRAPVGAASALPSPPPVTALEAAPEPSSAIAAPASATPLAKPGFIALANGSHWSDGGAVRYTGFLQNADIVRGPGAASASERRRELALDFTRPKDDDCLSVIIEVTKDLIGRHSCRGRCASSLKAYMRRSKGKELLWGEEPSAIEVLKYDQVGADEWRMSLSFDLKLTPPRGQNAKPIHMVGAVEDAEIIDTGEPVGLLGGEPAEMQPLPLDRLPTTLLQVGAR